MFDRLKNRMRDELEREYRAKITDLEQRLDECKFESAKREKRLNWDIAELKEKLASVTKKHEELQADLAESSPLLRDMRLSEEDAAYCAEKGFLVTEELAIAEMRLKFSRADGSERPVLEINAVRDERGRLKDFSALAYWDGGKRKGKEIRRKDGETAKEFIRRTVRSAADALCLEDEKKRLESKMARLEGEIRKSYGGEPREQEEKDGEEGV